MGKQKATSVKKIKVKRKYTRKHKQKSELKPLVISNGTFEVTQGSDTATEMEIQRYKGGNDSVFEFTKLNKEDKQKVYSFRRWVNTFVRNHNNHNNNNVMVDKFKNGLKSNTKFINTLIPVNNSFYPVDKQNLNNDNTTIVNSVPLLVILYKHFNDRIQLTDLFLKESGNINLISTRLEYNAISIAIELSDLELVDFLLEKGSNVTPEQNTKITTMRPLNSPSSISPSSISPSSIGPSTIERTFPSLNLNDESTSISKWKDIIPNLESIRTKLHELIDNEYKVCDLIQTIIPSNYTPTEIYIPDKPYISNNGTTIYPPTNEMKKNLTDDFHNYNRILCATIIIYGIIGQILNPYIQIVTKGGRATQLLVTDTYKTEDVDILILSDNTEVNTENVSANIGYLVKWFLESKFETEMEKTESDHPVYKVSYEKHVKKLGGKKSFKPFTDIDFTIPPKKEFYNNMVTYPFSTDFGQLLFTVPNIGSMLNEKLFYYNIYFLEKTKYMTNKLLKSIKSLNKTLAQQKNIDETELLQRRIDALSKQKTITFTASDMLSKTI